MKYPLHYPFVLTAEKVQDILKALKKLHEASKDLGRLLIAGTYPFNEYSLQDITIDCFGFIFFKRYAIGYLINANTFKLYRLLENTTDNIYGGNIPADKKYLCRSRLYQFSNVKKLERVNSYTLDTLPPERQAEINRLIRKARNIRHDWEIAKDRRLKNSRKNKNL